VRVIKTRNQLEGCSKQGEFFILVSSFAYSADLKIEMN
jgi:hypothetical protein